ncbi:MAG: hypothetical protein QOD81_4879 [Solirubrobacteraceae bacterium]|jgi:DNA primase|nr:hypothetical protein [Solirubrobacteraceae bacterium]
MTKMPEDVPAFRKTFSARRSRAFAANAQSKLVAARTPQDVASARAKSQRHGKVTADHWNQ